MFRMMFFMMLFNGQSKVYRGKKCKYKGLDKSHQEFKKHHKYVEQNGNN